MLIQQIIAILTKNDIKKGLNKAKSAKFASEIQTNMFHKKQQMRMKSLGYIGAFLGGAIAGAAIGLLVAPEKGRDTRVKITDTVEDFLRKHNIKLNRKEVGDLVDDIQDATAEE